MAHEDDKITYNALLKARDAFIKYIEDRDLDSAYWDTVFTAYILDGEFKRQRKVTIEEEVKE